MDYDDKWRTDRIIEIQSVGGDTDNLSYMELLNGQNNREVTVIIGRQLVLYGKTTVGSDSYRVSEENRLVVWRQMQLATIEADRPRNATPPILVGGYIGGFGPCGGVIGPGDFFAQLFGVQHEHHSVLVDQEDAQNVEPS